MKHTTTAPNIKALEAALASARALVASLEAVLMDADEGPELLDVKATAERYGVGRDGLKAAALRGELELLRGPRGKLLVERDAFEGWLRSRPYKPKTPTQTPDLSAWDDAAAAELCRIGGHHGR
jgi:hypothetical protein